MKSPVSTTARRLRPALIPLLLCVPLAAQQADYKPALVPDPVKGMHDTTPMSPGELAARRSGVRPRATAAPADSSVAAAIAQPLETVLFDRPGDGRLWARGQTYKASFGREGFVYVPFFGSSAPQNYPVQFVLRAVRVGGKALALPDVEPVLDRRRVTFDRGSVRERYDLDLERIEQTFVVDTTLAGDVEIEIGTASELPEDAATPGIQFGNALGRVDYGQAHVVDGQRLRPVPTTCEGNTIRIRVLAAERGPGPLVVDPVIHTSSYTAVQAGNASQPDIAYDATFDRYMVVWQHPFSATDMDVWSEFRNGDCTPVSGSLGSIDFTTLTHSNPRVANLNANDLFLVTMQRFEAGRWQIFGRRRLASTTPDSFVFAISDPLQLGECVNADVAGDSGTGDHWLVVWERQLSATDFDIHGKRVRADTFQTGTLWIENTASTIHSLPHVSQSNGNGFTTTPRWMVVYQFRFSATDEDVYGAVIDPNGTITTLSTPIDTSSFTDLVPSVSSPNTDSDAGGNPLFLVTYERQAPLEARARLLSPGFVNQINPVSLTAAFGLGPFWVRAECDGNRFAVLSGAATISAAAFAFTGTALVMHEAPHALVGIPSWPRLCSKRSGGGTHTDYGITFVEESTAPDRIWVSAYRGHAPSADFTRRVMACNGLQIDVAGLAMLGETMAFSLSNVGSDIPGFAFGLPLPATPLLCGTCQLGVDVNGVILLLGSSLPIVVPTTPGLVGYTGAVQGFGLGSGPCLLSLRFSDTIDFTIG
ncbi:MAG TPA: hypothetical protein VF384_19320 [Planctomycetota bacterium]